MAQAGDCACFSLEARQPVWVLREALGQLRRWRDQGLELSVAVNLSTRTLHDPELPQLVRDLIECRHPGTAAQQRQTELSPELAERAGRTAFHREKHGLKIQVSAVRFRPQPFYK